MAGNLVPRTDGGSDLGTVSKEWGTLYARALGGSVAGLMSPFRKPSQAYALSEMCLFPPLGFTFYLECTTAGTTGSTAPVISSPTVGGTVTDGSVVWTIRKSASTQDLTLYLPLAGGAMIGEIIKRAVNDRLLEICGGINYEHGAFLDLFGEDFTENPNGFWLSCSLGARLIGKPDGTLIWNDNDLGGSAIVAKSLSGSNGYVKRANGEIIQWGLEYEVTSSGKTVQYPISFPNATERVIVSPYYYTSSPATDPNTIVYVENTNGSQFSVKSNSASYVRVLWMAIGS